MEEEREKAQFAQQLIFICILVIHLHKRSYTRSRVSRLPAHGSEFWETEWIDCAQSTQDACVPPIFE